MHGAMITIAMNLRMQASAKKRRGGSEWQWWPWTQAEKPGGEGDGATRAAVCRAAGAQRFAVLTFYTNFDHLPYYKITIIMYFNYNIIYYIM
jgi:hypothetical protein